MKSVSMMKMKKGEGQKVFVMRKSSALELFSSQKSLGSMDARMMVLIRCFI